MFKFNSLTKNLHIATHASLVAQKADELFFLVKYKVHEL